MDSNAIKQECVPTELRRDLHILRLVVPIKNLRLGDAQVFVNIAEELDERLSRPEVARKM